MFFEGSEPHRIAEAERSSSNHLLHSCMAAPMTFLTVFVQSVQQYSKAAVDLVLGFISIPKISEKSGMFSVYTDVSEKLKTRWVFISDW